MDRIENPMHTHGCAYGVADDGAYALVETVIDKRNARRRVQK